MNCTHHPERQGSNLCILCGKWYCHACMDSARFPPTCIYCSRAAPSSKLGLPFILISGLFLFTKRIIKTGFSILLVLFLLGAALVLHRPFLYFFAAGTLLLMAFRFFKPRPAREKPTRVKHRRVKHITPEQVNTLLRISDNRITAKGLASATNTSLGVAEQYLNDLVRDGKLEVQAGEQELIYTKLYD